jgi:hypothetical protein
MASALGNVWQEAGADLGIQVTAPFQIATADGEFSFDALVHDFGSELGMLLFETWSDEKARVAKMLGYGYCCLGAGKYDRAETIATLQDWGWSGSSPAPTWL